MVRLNHSIELHPSVSLLTSPRQHVLSECTAGASAPRSWIDHEARGRDVRPAARSVRAHPCGSDDHVTIERDGGAARRIRDPQSPRLIGGETHRVAIGTSLGNDRVEHWIDLRPVAVNGLPDQHPVTVTGAATGIDGTVRSGTPRPALPIVNA